MVVTIVSPSARGIAVEAAPLATVVPLTLIVAFAWAAVGVIVIELTTLATVSVYAIVDDAKVGLKIPLLTT